ncbi:PAS domain-containing protein [Thermodesulfobacteriota bacterium B35]
MALFIVDDRLRIIEFNATAEEITGWPRKEALGRPCADVLASSLCGDRCPLRRARRTAGPAGNGMRLSIPVRARRRPLFFPAWPWWTRRAAWSMASSSFAMPRRSRSWRPRKRT